MNKRDKDTDATDIKMTFREYFDQLSVNIFGNLDTMDQLIPRDKYI